MSMRAWIVILLLANLAFAAWALLIDKPLAPPAARDISHLPRLLLPGEVAGKPAPGATAGAVGNHAGAGSNPTSAAANATTGATTGAAAGGVASAAANAHCVTVGPFSDLAIAAAAAALLQSRGFTPTQRDEPGPDLIVYWVYLDKLPSDAAANRLLKKLHDSGLTDARVMPLAAPAEGRRISVGLFNERSGAERRARQVRGLGLTPEITGQHESEASYWVDINLTSPGQSVSTQGLLPPAAVGAHLEIRDCPAPAGAAPK